MSGWLLDTNVISELRRPATVPGVRDFFAAQPLDTLYVSSVTLAEIRYGIDRLSDTEKRNALEEWLSKQVRPMFEGRILEVSEDVMMKWRLMVERGKQANHTFPQPDLIIGATAEVHGLTVVTRNIRDFEKSGVPLFNPWTDSV